MLDKFKQDKTEVKIMLVTTGFNIINIAPFVSAVGYNVDDVLARFTKTGLDDHYFDLYGTYLGYSKNCYGRVRIINKKDGDNGFVLSSIYTNQANQVIDKTKGNANSQSMSNHIIFLKSQNRQQELYDMFGKIINHYEKEAVWSNVSTVLKVMDDPKNLALAVTRKAELKIYFNVGSSTKDFDFYNQIINIIFHEKVHYSITDASDLSFRGHAELVYQRQVADDIHFKDCTFAYKKERLIGYGCYITGAEKVAKENATSMQNLKDIFFGETKKIGYAISFSSLIYDYDLTITNLIDGSYTNFDCKEIIESEKILQKIK